MYKPGTEQAEKRIQKSCGPTIRKTTDEHFEVLLPGCDCSCAKLEEILGKVRRSYDYRTAFRTRFGELSPAKILVIPAGSTEPDSTKDLNEAAKQAGCKIRFEFHYSSTGTMIVIPA